MADGVRGKTGDSVRSLVEMGPAPEHVSVTTTTTTTRTTTTTTTTTTAGATSQRTPP